METLTDEALVEHVRQGRRDAFAELVDRHKRYVLTLIMCRVTGRETAEDLAQEVFIKLYRFLPGFRGECRFTTWLYRLTLNTVSDHVRSTRRQPVMAVIDTVKGWISDQRDQPEAQAIRQEERETVVKLLTSLPVKYRDILYLSHYRYLSYQEIAELLALPVKTVETRLYRARKLMKQQWLEVNGLENGPSERTHHGTASNPYSESP